MTAGTVAQNVQGSGYGGRYDEVREEAKAIVDGGRGGAGGGGFAPSDKDAYLERFAFVQKRGESAYAFARRLMDEVHWRVFAREGVIVIASEPALARAPPSLVLDELLLEQDDFEQHRALRAGEASLQALIGAYDADPGETVIIDTLPQLEDANWLIASSRVDLLDDIPLVDISVRLPQPPTAEPSSTVKTRASDDSDTSQGGSGGGGGAAGLASGSPKNVIDRLVLPVARRHGINVTAATVATANAGHGGVGGGAGTGSDHQGPPTVRWAADMSNGNNVTPQMTALARELAKNFDIPWTMSKGIAEATRGGYRYQLIYNIDLGSGGGNHFNHVHFGVKRA